MAAHSGPAFGDLIRQARLNAQLTQEELAERSGLSVRGISDLERGLIRAPRRDTLVLLAEALALPDEERQRWEELRWRYATQERPPASERRTTTGGQLPHPLTSFIGRERDLTAVTALLSRPPVRLVTLTGPGGVGKTRLALAVTEGLRDSVRHRAIYIPLQSVPNPYLVPAAIAQALQVREVRDRMLVEQLVEVLRDEHALLVLDNFEHLLPAASLVGDLLTGCPTLTILATSRAVLHLYGEHIYPVPPLAVPDAADGLTLEKVQDCEAVQLFTARAHAANSGFRLTAKNANTVAEICARLDGLPLALELAAARMRVLSPAALLARLEQRLTVLSGGPRNVPARQQTIRETIAWSYDLLAEDEQRFFRHLAVFAGGFTLDAARHVAAADGPSGSDVFDRVTSLVEKSLVELVAGSRLAAGIEPPGEPRFTMLETIRDFALNELVESGDEYATRQAHAGYFRALAERAEPELRGAAQTEWIARLENELPNLRAALDWSLKSGNAANGLRLAGSLYWFWFIRSHVSEGRDWFERARTAAQTPLASAARVAIGASLLAWRGAEHATSKVYCDEALELFHKSGDHWGVALATHQAGHLAQDLEHDLEKAIALFSESVAQYEALDEPWGVALSKRCLAWALIAANDYDRAASLLQSALATFRQVGDQWNIGNALRTLGDVARGQERWTEAISYYQESLAQHWMLGGILGATDALLRLAETFALAGAMEQAARCFGCAEAHREHTGVMLWKSYHRSYEPVIAKVRAALGEESFQAEWQAGRSLSLEEAVEATTGIRLEPGAARTPTPAPAPIAALSRREREVLSLIVEGLSNQEIAAELFISPNTVATHVANIMNKLGLDSRTTVAAWAVRHGLA